jgi:cation transport protein ChaC
MTGSAFWVFGYGSLMWKPGFDYAERHAATLHGWRRALCVYSHVHRGTPDRPGLVLGLDRGGSCRGVAFRVEESQRAATLAYLRERELVTHVYHEIEGGVRLDDGRRVRALVYVVDQRHAQYAGRLDRAHQLAFVKQGRGVSGANRDYVLNTQEHLVELGVRDATLAWLAAQLT